jgi:hypothetical protein
MQRASASFLRCEDAENISAWPFLNEGHTGFRPPLGTYREKAFKEAAF